MYFISYLLKLMFYSLNCAMDVLMNDFTRELIF